MDKGTCVICESEIKGYGNNPWPVTEEGRCCDTCNNLYVIPARIAHLYGNKDETRKEE